MQSLRHLQLEIGVRGFQGLLLLHRESIQGTSTTGSSPRQQVKAGQLAEGVAVMSQELKTPDEKAKTDTSEAVAAARPLEKQSQPSKEHSFVPSYSSAAAFLGFRSVQAIC